MTSRAAARKYARALLDVAARESDPEQVAEELGRFVAVIARHDDLRRVVAHPAIPVARKRALVERLLERGPAISPLLGKLLLLLADRDRLGLLGELQAAYDDALLDHRRVVRAELVTAVPLSEDRRRAVEQRIAEATGKQVQLVSRVDPGIIGGAVTKVGSIVYDGSVVGHLERLKARLVEGAP